MSDDSGKGDDSGKLLYCSFCGKSQHEVRKLIAGPSVFICDECVELCNDIIREEVAEAAESTESSKLPVPTEINRILDEYVWPSSRQRKFCPLLVTTTISDSTTVQRKTTLSCLSLIFC